MTKHLRICEIFDTWNSYSHLWKSLERLTLWKSMEISDRRCRRGNRRSPNLVQIWRPLWLGCTESQQYKPNTNGNEAVVGNSFGLGCFSNVLGFRFCISWILSNGMKWHATASSARKWRVGEVINLKRRPDRRESIEELPSKSFRWQSRYLEDFTWHGLGFGSSDALLISSYMFVNM